MLVCVILFTSFYNCTSVKTDVKSQKISTDSLSLIAQVGNEVYKSDKPEQKFVIPIEGYKATSLGKAVYDGDTGLIQELISSGLTSERCLTDETYVFDILYTALEFKKLDVVRFILQHKLFADINVTYSEDAETPLTLACNLPENEVTFEIVKSLIKLGANIDGAGESGGEETKYPIIIAVSQNNFRLTQYLLDHGVNKDVKNSQGETLLMIAQKNGNIEIEGLLRSN